jgi:hypothetical protein
MSPGQPSYGPLGSLLVSARSRQFKSFHVFRLSARYNFAQVSVHLVNFASDTALRTSAVSLLFSLRLSAVFLLLARRRAAFLCLTNLSRADVQNGLNLRLAYDLGIVLRPPPLYGVNELTIRRVDALRDYLPDQRSRV